MIREVLSRIRIPLFVFCLIPVFALVWAVFAGPFLAGPPDTYGESPAYARAAEISARAMDRQMGTRDDILSRAAEGPAVQLASSHLTANCTVHCLAPPGLLTIEALPACDPGAQKGPPLGRRIRPRPGPPRRPRITSGGPFCTTERGSQCITWDGPGCNTHLSNPLCNTSRGSQCFTWDGPGCVTHRNNPQCNSAQGSQCVTWDGPGCNTHSNNPKCNSMQGSQCVTWEGPRCNTHVNNPKCNSAQGSQCNTWDGPGCNTHRNNPLCNTIRGSQCITYDGRACNTHRNNPYCNTVKQDDCITFEGPRCATNQNNPACGIKTFLADNDCNTQAARAGGECVTSRGTDPACMTHVNNCLANPFANPTWPGILAPLFSGEAAELHGAPERDLSMGRPLAALAVLLLAGLVPGAALLRRRDS